MPEETCRPERVTVDGEDVPVLVRGEGPMTDEDRYYLQILVKAIRTRESAPEATETTHTGAAGAAPSGTGHRVGGP